MGIEYCKQTIKKKPGRVSLLKLRLAAPDQGGNEEVSSLQAKRETEKIDWLRSIAVNVSDSGFIVPMFDSTQATLLAALFMTLIFVIKAEEAFSKTKLHAKPINMREDIAS